jgi:hypothetical protein
MRTLLLGIGLLLCAPAATASVYVVDDTPGAGVHFTDLRAAVAASVAGDVLLVRPGDYYVFQLTHGLTILADPGARVVYGSTSTTVRVTNLPAGQRAVLSGLIVADLAVTGCAGPVVLERISPATDRGAQITVSTSADVRLRACNGVGVVANGARVEATDSALVGRRGTDGCVSDECGGSQNVTGGTGLPGIDCINGGEVHASLCTVTGGRGGEGGWLVTCPNGNGGVGGPGIRVASGGMVLLTGSGAQTIAGGAGGPGATGGFCTAGANGAPGAAASVTNGVLLHSNVAFGPGAQGSLTQVVPADPALQALGTGAAGTQVTFRVYGQPGDEARVRLGRQLVVQDLPTTFEDRLTIPLRSYGLGILPATGQATFVFTVPTSLAPGFVLVAQASTTSPQGETRLTQSAPIAVR